MERLIYMQKREPTMPRLSEGRRKPLVQM